MGRGPLIITSSRSFETVGSGILIYERLQLTAVYTYGQLCNFDENFEGNFYGKFYRNFDGIFENYLIKILMKILVGI